MGREVIHPHGRAERPRASGLPSPETVRGDLAFSQHLRSALVYDEFDLTICQEIAVEHGFLVPMHLCFDPQESGWPVASIPLEDRFRHHTKRLAVAPIATQSKKPMIVMSAAASAITDASPFVIRSSFTVAQVSVPLADYVTKNGMRRVVTLVTDYAPGVDAEQSFAARFKADGGQVLDTLRVPLKSPDYALFMQKVRDLHPDGLFIFVPAPEAPAVVKQFRERGLDRAGVRLIGTGDVVDDDSLDHIGDDALGILAAHHYSAAHSSVANEAFVRAFEKANQGAAAELHGGGRLRRHEPSLQGLGQDRRHRQRRVAGGRDEGPGDR